MEDNELSAEQGVVAVAEAEAPKIDKRTREYRALKQREEAEQAVAANAARVAAQVALLQKAVVGLPVQYGHVDEGPVPAFLQRKCTAEGEGVWDVKISLRGTMMFVARTAVRFSETPKSGCWNFLPI